MRQHETTRRIIRKVAELAGKQRSLKVAVILKKIAKVLLPKESEVRVGCKSRMVVYPRISVSFYLGFDGAEPGVHKVLHEKCKEGDTFVDVGAYSGYYSLWVYERVGEIGRVVAFEPNPESFKVLQRNIERNKYDIIAENVALSDQEGYADFTLRNSMSRFTKIGGTPIGEAIKVRTTTFDNYRKLTNIIPNFIKIDVEGAEYSVLKGMEETLQIYNPSLLIEIHHDANYELFDFLEDIGYSICLVDEEGISSIDTSEIMERLKDRQWDKYGTISSRHILAEKTRGNCIKDGRGGFSKA